MSETFINDFDHPYSTYKDLLFELNQKRLVLRSGVWTSDEENKMLEEFIRGRVSALTGFFDEKIKNDYTLPIMRDNEDYFHKRFVKTTVNYDKFYVAVAYRLASGGTRVGDTNYLSFVLSNINDYVSLLQGYTQKQIFNRAIMLHNINKIMGIHSYIINGKNSVNGERSLFVVMPGRFKNPETNKEVDAWQIVNPASYSSVILGNTDFPYPSRVFLSEGQLESLCNRPTQFEILYKAPADNANVKRMLNDSDVKRAVIKNVGNLDFGIEDLQPVKQKEMEASK